MRGKDPNRDFRELMVELFKDIEMAFQGFGSLLKNIWRFFTNPSILISFFKLNSLDSVYNKFLENEALMKLLALIAAVVLVITSRYTTDVFLNQTTQIIPNQELVTLINPNHIIVDGAIPDRVEVMLIGERNHVEVAMRQQNLELYVDLRHLTPGTHNVPVMDRNIVNRVDVRTNPGSFIVTIAEIEEAIWEVEPIIVNRHYLDEQSVITEPMLSLDKVQIKGAGSVLANIATVRASIDIEAINDGVREFEAPITVFDSNMNVLNVEIIPDRLTATVEVFNDSELIPLAYSVAGSPPAGLSIHEIVFDPPLIEMFGERSVLEQLEQVVIPVNLYQLNENHEMVIPISLPPGIQYMTENQVTVRVIYEETHSRTFRNVNIRRTNLGSGLTLASSSSDNTRVDVMVIGAPSLLERLSETDINVFVDLSDLGAGDFQIPIMVEIPEFMSADLGHSMIHIIIEE